MNRLIFGARLGDKDLIAKITKQIFSLEATRTQQHIEREIAALDRLTDESPLAEDDWILAVVRSAERQRITPEDVATQEKLQRCEKFAVEAATQMCVWIPGMMSMP